MNIELKLTTGKPLLRALFISCIVQNKSFKLNDPNVKRNVQLKKKLLELPRKIIVIFMYLCEIFLLESKNI